MAFSLAQKFVNLGMASPLAVEYANQVQSGVYNWKRLMWLGMVPQLAKYVTESLQAATFNPRTAIEKGMSEAVANLTKAQDGPLTLPYTPYVVLLGDSQATGSAALDIATNVATYNARDVAVRNRIKAMAAPVTNQAFNGWMTYTPATPGTVAGTGLRQGSGQANIGPDIGFIERFVDKYTNDLYIIKDTLPGAFQGNQALGTVTGSISAGVLTTDVSGSVKASDYITGPGIPTGTYVANGSGTAWNLGIIGSTATPAISPTGSISINVFNGGLSFKKGQSPIYSGFAKRTVGGVKQHLIDAVAAVPNNPVCVGVLYWFGTNDKSDNTTTAEFSQNVQDFLNQLFLDVPSLANGPTITWPQIRGINANSLTVRANQIDLKAIYPKLRIVETDNYTLIPDGTHFNIEGGYRQVGQDWFKVVFQGFAGI